MKNAWRTYVVLVPFQCLLLCLLCNVSQADNATDAVEAVAVPYLLSNLSAPGVSVTPIVTKHELLGGMPLAHTYLKASYANLPVLRWGAVVHSTVSAGTYRVQDYAATALPDLSRVPTKSPLLPGNAAQLALQYVKVQFGDLKLSIGKSALAIAMLPGPSGVISPALVYQVIFNNQAPGEAVGMAGTISKIEVLLNASAGPYLAKLATPINTGIRELDCTPPAYCQQGQLCRQVYDCGVVNGSCKLDRVYYYAGNPYCFGRSEFAPERGLDPIPAFNNRNTDAAHTIMGNCYTYIQTLGLPNGPNGQGGYGDGASIPPGESRVAVYAGFYDQTSCPNAWYNYNWTNFCNNTLDQDESGTTMGEDIVGHEYFHAVKQFAIPPDGLTYAGESGALDESLSDVFGELVERYITGSTDWKMGTYWWKADPDLPTGHALRNLSNPPEYVFNGIVIQNRHYPDRYYSPDFYCGPEDDFHEKLHFNSTVVSKAFYLMANGGTFNYCHVNAIGPDKVAQIAYRAISTKFVADETFNQAYNAINQACQELYPAADCAQVRNALKAVELDQPGICSGVPGHRPLCLTQLPPDAVLVHQSKPLIDP